MDLENLYLNLLSSCAEKDDIPEFLNLVEKYSLETQTSHRARPLHQLFGALYDITHDISITNPADTTLQDVGTVMIRCLPEASASVYITDTLSLIANTNPEYFTQILPAYYEKVLDWDRDRLRTLETGQPLVSTRFTFPKASEDQQPDQYVHLQVLNSPSLNLGLIMRGWILHKYPRSRL